jgi:inactivated superfamily I helicase
MKKTDNKRFYSLFFSEKIRKKIILKQKIIQECSLNRIYLYFLITIAKEIKLTWKEKKRKTDDETIR